MPATAEPAGGTAAEDAAFAAWQLRLMDAADLALLRRKGRTGQTPAFWRLAAQRPASIGDPRRADEWACIIRIMALLMPKGAPGRRAKLHDRDRRLGAVLCDGGDPEWPGEAAPRPKVSEARLKALLASRGRERLQRLAQAARMLRLAPGTGLDVGDLAHAALFPSDAGRISRHYHRRLLAARNPDPETPTEGDPSP